MIKRGDIITADLMNGIEASILRRIPSKMARRARQLPILPIHQKPFQISPFSGGVTVGAGRVYYYTKLFKQDDYGYSSADFQIGFMDFPEQTFETNYDLYSIIVEAKEALDYFQVFQNIQNANGDFVEYSVKQRFVRAVPTGKLILKSGDSPTIIDNTPSRIIASVLNNQVIYHVGNVIRLLVSPTDILEIKNSAEKEAISLTISTTIVPAEGGTITCRVVPKEESTVWNLDCEELRLFWGGDLPGSIFTGSQTFNLEIPQNTTGTARTGTIRVWDNDNNQKSAEFTQL